MTMKVLVFKTDVSTVEEIEQLSSGLSSIVSYWNFDLEDCDRILRATGEDDLSPAVVAFLASEGFRCEELLDRKNE